MLFTVPFLPLKSSRLIELIANCDKRHLHFITMSEVLDSFCSLKVHPALLSLKMFISGETSLFQLGEGGLQSLILIYRALCIFYLIYRVECLMYFCFNSACSLPCVCLDAVRSVYSGVVVWL